MGCWPGGLGGGFGPHNSRRRPGGVGAPCVYFSPLSAAPLALARLAALPPSDPACRFSSVERGRKKTTSKLKKVYVSKTPKPLRRKNASHSNIDAINLVCCDQGCLLRQGVMNVRQIVRQERRKVFEKPYDVQNYVMSKLLRVKICPSGYRKIGYSIPTLGPVCKIAFMKCYGVSERKIRVLSKKMDCDGICIERDMRGRHANRPRRLTWEARRQVRDFISSHPASKSHYRRARTQKLFFDSPISMRRMWKDFTTQHPDFISTRLAVRNKGPVISFSAFRNIFIEDLSKMLGFRKPREDTCQVCDMNMSSKLRIQSAIEKGQGCSASKQRELQQLEIEHEKHLKESESRFAAQKHDMVVLAKKRKE